MIRVLLALLPCCAFIAAFPVHEALGRAFYLPENPRYTIVDSSLDSIRFTLNKTVRRNDRGHLVSISSFVDPDGHVIAWHDFGQLEGPGWAANAVGGADEIYRWGTFLGRKDWQDQALSILDHVLEDGFIDPNTGLIRGYRETTTDKLCLNYKHNSDWFCPGSMAKVAFQLLIFSDRLGNDPRANRMRQAAIRCAAWIDRNVESVPNGWFPRRVTPEGKVYRQSPDGGNDDFWQSSADGLFILQLQAALMDCGVDDYREQLKAKTAVFIGSGGIFGSINHDTYDPHENVAYSVAFRTLILASRVLNDESIRDFAYQQCLTGLDQFKMTDDRNGVATKGLLYMEKSWDTAYLWENAEAALAWFEAAVDRRKSDPERSREYELDGLTVLRSAARHHYGPHGFLTEGVDWNNHVGEQHHIGEAQYAAIRYTEPFLNNQHIAEPTLYYLGHLAVKIRDGEATEYRDCEGNLLIRLLPPNDLTQSSDILTLARSYADGGGYNWTPGNSGTPIEIDFAGERILAKGDGTICCGFTLAVAIEVAQRRGLLDGKHVKEIRAFQTRWYGDSDASKESLCVYAVEKLGIGTAVPLADARPGDFVQFWRTNGSGHSVILLDWIRDANSIVGLKYRSSQKSTNGIGDRVEYFADVPGREGSVVRSRTHVCRLNEAASAKALSIE